jgi:peptidoglycan/xylan/chitin deacetylase (PgdA/CDA1 family)
VAAIAAGILLSLSSLPAAARGEPPRPVPILVYHRVGPVLADSMTVTTPTFEWQLRYLAERGYTVIPLRRFVDARLGHAPPPPPRAVILTVDDGHRSVYEVMLPLLRRHRVPVTLFIYPSAIANASYAMTWDQLRELQETGLFEIQSHTYWHPNFKVERRRLSPPAFERFVMDQLLRSRDRLHAALGATIDMLSWPFGIYDAELLSFARATGYVAGVTLDRRPAEWSDDLLALPRYLVTDRDRGAAFERMVSTGHPDGAR